MFADAYIITVCQPSSCLSLACTATVPVNSDVGDALIDLVDNSNTFVQQRGPSSGGVGHSFSSPSHFKASNTWLDPALSRLYPWPRRIELSPHNPPLSNSLTSFRVRRQGPKSVRPKRAALRLLDGLARDVPQPARKEGYIKTATIVKDTAP